MVTDEGAFGPGDRSDPLIGQIIANYRVLGRLGQGGMGAVYLVQHTVLGRQAAIKVLLPEFSNNRELVARFLNEARATARLRHRGFVEIFDSGTLGDGSAYLVMEYLRGANFAAAIEWRKTLAWNEASAVLRDVAASVAHAHQHGIVHRDLKPDNIFLAVGDESDPRADRARTTVKVLDFGIAKLTTAAGAPGGAARTRTGSLLGTPLYMSPEQCRGAGQVDHRTDIYSLGCIAYHALAGQPPFPLEGFGEIISAHLNTPPRSLRAQLKSLPEAVEAFVFSLLAKDPGARPQSMDAVLTALDGLGAPGGDADLFALIPPLALASPLPVLSSSPGPRVATTPMSNSYFGGNPTPPPVGKSGGTRRLPVDTAGAGPVAFSTFAGAASEVIPPGSAVRSGGRRGVGLTIGILVGAGLVAALVVGLRRGDHTDLVRRPEAIAPIAGKETPEVQRPTVEPANPPAAPGPAASEVQRPPASGNARAGRPEDQEPQPTVTVRLKSVPAGAEVIDPRSKRTLGLTPFEAAFPSAKGDVILMLRKRGFQPQRITLDLTKDTDMTAILTKHPSATTNAPDNSEEEERRKL